MSSVFLTGARVRLRPLEPEDAPRIAGYLNNPDVRRGILRHRPQTVGQQSTFLEKIAQSEHDVLMGIMGLSDDGLRGVTGLHALDFKNRHCEFGIFIGDKAHWGKGLATDATRLMVGYAFDTLNLHRVQLSVYEDNVAGIRAYEKVGFRREGVARQQLFREGRYWDAITMALLREEWVSPRGKPA